MLFDKCFPSLNSTLKGLGSVLSITSDSFHKQILGDDGWAGFVGKYCFLFVRLYSELLFEYLYWNLSPKGPWAHRSLPEPEKRAHLCV